ncbi:hypothetical protein G4B88_027688 [Cannabis sativa]|uniref:Kinesin light chain n=1 Tax=Cannabis sativa TaxID=3483 RepID=A0A7J6ERY2_CANSA|nr:hypothetical protein G4B88_027688 [Cannabis sativa]
MQLEGKQNAIFAYQKALTVFKTTKGENHPSVGSVFVRLADLYNRTGKIRESKSYCENALRIYEKPMIGIPVEEIASGLSDISTIYESIDELEQALKLLEKALKIYNDAPGQQSTIAGIEAQMGLKKEMSSHEGPPGYDPPAATATATATATVADTKPKTKSVKRNERKKEKEKRIQHDF